MQGIATGSYGQIDNVMGIQIANNRICANVVSLVSLFDMQRVAVCIGVNGHGFDAHFAARTHNTYGNFSTIGNEYLFDHAKPSPEPDWSAFVLTKKAAQNNMIGLCLHCKPLIA